MRRHFIFIVIAIITSWANCISAQSKWWDGTKSNDGITLRGELGLNLSQFIHVERWNEIKAGLNVGVMAEKPILNSLSAKAGVFYTMKGSVGNNDGGFGGDLKTTFSPSYLEIPLLASYRYTINEQFRVQFDFGPYFAFGLHGKDTKKYSGNGSYTKPTTTKTDVFSKDQLKRFDFGFRFGPEVIFGDKLAIGLKYEVSAIDISNMGGKIGNSNFMINLSFPFLKL